ncbi:uncharacterized protein UV8b_00335 [Ustilaginoidea virens]|uniref:Uncharacterized protein n=1 Tax=Ustilaginoidea virens TaxID=1159556 RepID=A0A8E5HJI3_USTVR|nr:uncharacterized protein UV8b_00335 [Ustilaginoidea virens]QUC16094.1 hypothetical protein UV8b_00335 [Ustilaginoidea virens]
MTLPSGPGVAQHGSTVSSCFQPRTKTGCRSVKSIVAWLESSRNPPWTAPRGAVANLPHDLSTSSISSSRGLQRRNRSASEASDVEEDSLTYLGYREYFGGAPLGRCLDRQDDSPQASMSSNVRCYLAISDEELETGADASKSEDGGSCRREPSSLDNIDDFFNQVDEVGGR